MIGVLGFLITAACFFVLGSLWEGCRRGGSLDTHKQNAFLLARAHQQDAELAAAEATVAYLNSRLNRTRP